MTFGASPRASINMVLGAKALAFLRGRDYALPADVRELARDVLRHRVVLSYEALADDVVARRPARPAPRGGPAAGASTPGAATGSERGPRPRGRRGDRDAGRRTGRPLTPERVLRRLEWRVLRRLDGRLQGDYRTVFRGTGRRRRRPARVPVRRRPAPHRLERHRAHGRAPRAGVPRGPRGHGLAAARPLGVDGLRAGRSGSKHVVLAEVAATLAQLLSRGGNRVGALIFDAAAARDDPARVGPQPGAADPRRGCCRRRPLPPARDPPTSAPRCARRSGSCGAGRCVVIVSDFLSEPGWQGLLGQLARRHDVVAIQVVDRARVRAARRGDGLRRGRRDR